MYVEPRGEEGEETHWLKEEGVLQVNVPGVQGRGRAVGVEEGNGEDVIEGRVLVRGVVGVVELEVVSGEAEDAKRLVDVLLRSVGEAEVEVPIVKALLVKVLVVKVVAELATFEEMLLEVK